MRNILVFAAVLIGLGVAMARIADTMTPAKSTVANSTIANSTIAMSRSAEVASTAPASSGRTVSLDKDRNGHFQTEARVGGSYLNFMVDTGATVIALKERDAERLGIHPAPADFTANVSTANGPAKAARAKLDSIEIGDVRVRDVDALIMPDGMLDQNLLGMAFLSRLKRFEYTDGKLVMEQ